MRRRLVALFAVILFGVGTTACNSDEDDRPLLDVTTTTEEPTTTAPTTIPSGPPATEKAAADGLFDAWQRGDREGAASRYAKPGAINELFSHPNTGDVDYGDQGCEPQGGQFICSWTYPGGALQMTVEAWPGGGFVVDDVSYLVD